MNLIQSHLGELASLLTAFCWCFSAMAFESAGKRVGSLSVNYLRISVAFPLLAIASFFTRGLAFPTDATGEAWFWLSISGLIGFVLGDIFLFEAFVEIGSRVSLLIKSMGPPIAALAGFIIMGETISSGGVLGIFLTMLGISIVVLSKNPAEKKVRFNRPLRGIFYAVLGALGQALGLVFSKLGMGSYNAMAATQIRLIAAFIAFSIIITLRKKWPEIGKSFKNKQALGFIALGAALGPFIGVTSSLVALKYTAAGIVSSITSISPVLIIPFSILVFKEKVLPKEVLGALISIAGVILLFL